VHFCVLIMVGPLPWRLHTRAALPCDPQIAISTDDVYKTAEQIRAAGGSVRGPLGRTPDQWRASIYSTNVGDAFMNAAGMHAWLLQSPALAYTCTAASLLMRVRSRTHVRFCLRHAHLRTRVHTHAHTHTRAHTRTHAHTHAHTPKLHVRTQTRPDHARARPCAWHRDQDRGLHGP
jgi:hypothetical protein